MERQIKTGIKYLQIVHMIRNLYQEYIKNSQKSTQNLRKQKTQLKLAKYFNTLTKNIYIYGWKICRWKDATHP